MLKTRLSSPTQAPSFAFSPATDLNSRLAFPSDRDFKYRNLSIERTLISHASNLKDILEKTIKPEICGITHLNEYGCRLYIGEPIDIGKTTIKFCGCNLVEGKVTGKIGMVDLYFEAGTIVISKLAIEEAFRGQKYASRIVKAFLNYSDLSRTPVQFSNVKNEQIDALLRKLHLKISVTGRKHIRINFSYLPN